MYYQRWPRVNVSPAESDGLFQRIVVIVPNTKVVYSLPAVARWFCSPLFFLARHDIIGVDIVPAGCLVENLFVLDP